MHHSFCLHMPMHIQYAVLCSTWTFLFFYISLHFTNTVFLSIYIALVQNQWLRCRISESNFNPNLFQHAPNGELGVKLNHQLVSGSPPVEKGDEVERYDGSRRTGSGSVWKSSPKTGKRPRLDRTKTGTDRTSSPGLLFLRIKDRKKTGLNRWIRTPNLPLQKKPKITQNR